MIITKRIVFLNFPKTGSSFVRTVIKEIYRRRINDNVFIRLGLKLKIIKPPIRELILPNILLKKGIADTLDQHGHYSQIPEKDKNKLIVSVVRNPYDRLLSLYEFRFWKKNPALDIKIIKNHLPNFPDLDLDEFVEYLKLVAKHSIFENKNNVKIGPMSLQLIQFFFRDPKNVLNKIDRDYLTSNKLFINDIAPIHFLKQENLNKDLGDFLLENKFSKEEVDFVLNFEKVNVTKKLYNDRSKLMTNNAIKYIEEYECFYIMVLKYFKINYNIN